MEYKYDLQAKDPEGDKLTYRIGQKTAAILPLGQRSTMAYDAVGNLKTTTDSNGKTTTYVYNPLNQLSAKQFQDGSAWTFTYTPTGQRDIVTLLDSTQQVVDRYDYDYNKRDWLIQRTDSLSGAPSRTIGYTYDLAGNKTSVITPSQTVNYTYDSRNRLDQVIQNGTTLADYDYNAVNNLTRTTFSNGTQEVRQYDLLNRLTYLENNKGGTVLSSYAYTLDKVGNRTQITEQDGRTSNYVYDDLYRLTQEKINDPTNGNRTTDFVYDKVGNRLGQTETINGTTKTTTYIYDANDRLLSEASNGQTTSYTYDNKGNTLSKQDSSGTTEYTWNDEGRLIQAVTKDANGSTLHQMEYRYNSSGIRVVSGTDGQQTFNLIDSSQGNAQVLEEYNNTGAVQAAYVYGNDLISQTKDNLTTYYLVDGLGSTRLLTDAQGNVLNTYDYDAFGKTINQSGTATNPYLFAGEQFDSGLGDYYLRDRFYDPGIGRFSRADTFQGVLRSPITAHKYLYANNNPINLIDPSGFYAASMSEVSAAQIVLDALVIYTYAQYNKTITTDYTPEKLGGFGEGDRPPTILEGISAWRNTWKPEPLGGFGEGAQLDIPNYTGHPRDHSLSSLIRYVFGINIDVAYDIAYGHAWPDHVEEWQSIGVNSEQELAEHIESIMMNAEKSKTSGKRTAFWDERTQTIVIENPADPDGGTAFRPTRGIDYYNDWPDVGY